MSTEFVGVKPRTTSFHANFKMRACMNDECKKMFLSTGPHHRLCEECRHKSVSPGDDLHPVNI